MTGYGRAKKTLSNRDITVEVRSVNNRYLDCTVKLPRAYIFAEDAIKGRVQKAISRGKVDGDEHIDLAARDGLLHASLDGVLHEDVGARQLHRAVEITVVDRAHLDGDIAIGERFFGSSIASHTFDHDSSPP